MQKVRLRRTRRIQSGHLWIFSNELNESPKKFEPGSLVEVYDMRDEFLGIGYINPNSLIAIRLLTRAREKIDSDFFRRRLMSALDMRTGLLHSGDACRLVYSEGDYLPGLIADRYGDCLVLQILTYGIEALKETIIGLLDDLLRPQKIVLRNDSRVRTLEGLPLYKETIKGDPDYMPVIREDGLLFRIDPYGGQKTGFFLDQRYNRRELTRYIKGGRGLDLFSYIGAWSMHLAAAGAEILCVDSSEKALYHAKDNAVLNSIDSRVGFAVEDVFSFLDRDIISGERKYDFIVLDPPAFVKSSNRIKEAVKAYKEINEMCIRLIKPGGILASSSCSYHIEKDVFVDILSSAAKNVNRSLRLLEMRSQSPDHPVLLSVPETEYLKCAFLVVD